MWLPVAVPVPGLLQQGHQHAAEHPEPPALLRAPDGQQELRILPECVWSRAQRGGSGLPAPLTYRSHRLRAPPLGFLPTQRPMWRESGCQPHLYLPSHSTSSTQPSSIDTQMGSLLAVEGPLPSAFTVQLSDCISSWRRSVHDLGEVCILTGTKP